MPSGKWKGVPMGPGSPGGAGIPAGMPRCFESVSGGVAPLDHRLQAGMPPAFL